MFWALRKSNLFVLADIPVSLLILCLIHLYYILIYKNISLTRIGIGLSR